MEHISNRTAAELRMITLTRKSLNQVTKLVFTFVDISFSS